MSVPQRPGTPAKPGQGPGRHPRPTGRPMTGRGPNRQRAFGIMNRNQAVAGIQVTADRAGDFLIRRRLANGTIEVQGVFEAATDFGEEPTLSGESGFVVPGVDGQRGGELTLVHVVLAVPPR